jgi:hypothetical protein
VVSRFLLHLVVLDPTRVARAAQSNFSRHALDLFLDGDQLGFCLQLPDSVDSRRNNYAVIAVVAALPVIYWLGVVPELDTELVPAIIRGERLLADRASEGFIHLELS